MLIFNLGPIFKARGIERPYSFLVKSGISHTSAINILNSQTRSFKLEHVEILCNVLNCEPNDLLAWIPNKNQQNTENSPLNKLKQTTTGVSIQETIAAMPYKEADS